MVYIIEYTCMYIIEKNLQFSLKMKKDYVGSDSSP